MAVSDPTYGVPTPTGVLQGVAAFSFDGSAWQPAASAGPCVGTPTGVLMGVAPFSWSGSAWTPAGRSQPGVGTPTGVLNGAAVYTWSGSAWTPSGGSPTPSTPTGALRGIAAFTWDGSQWQPAGQAGPDVPTPFGVLQGAAMFNWSGTAWVAGSATAPPTIDINFLAATLDPSITWSRTSTATDGLYTDAVGSSFNSFAAAAPRINTTNGLLIENQRTNSLLNSGAPVTQTTTSLAIGTYTLWVIGTGSATSSAGTAVGSGFGVATAGTPNVITITTAGTVTVTVAGSLTRFQLENGAWATSYIPTTGATAQRTGDSGTTATGAWYNSAEGTLCVDFLQKQANTASDDLPGLSGAATTDNLSLRLVNNTVGLFCFVANANVGGGGTIPGTFTANAVNRVAFTYTASTRALQACLNGGTVNVGTASSLPPITQLKYGLVRAAAQDGFTRRVRYWPRAMASAELQSVTT